MAEAHDVPAWILLFFGIYALAASLGEFRQPGFWKSMIDDFERVPALRFLTGIVCIVLGAAIYLTNPWIPRDWMSVVVTVIGGWVVVEGVMFLAFGDKFIKLSALMMGGGMRIWAIAGAAGGGAMIVAALLRL